MKSIPETRMYSRQHIWIEMEDDFIGRCGITDRHLEKIDLVEFIDFPELDILVQMDERTGRIESNRALFDIHSPVSGRIIEINRVLENHPDLINQDPYGEGWIYRIDVKEPNEFHHLMDEIEYLNYSENEGDI